MATATLPAFKLPPADKVRDTLDSVLGSTVAVQDIEPWAPSRQELGATAEYMDDLGIVRVVTTFDYPLAVYAGAAIGQVPADDAQAMVKEHTADSTVLENVNEVLNILASLYNEDGDPHVKLSATHAPENLLPRSIVQVLVRRAGRLDADITIQGYGTGRASFVLAQ